MKMKQKKSEEEHVAHDSPSVFLFCLHDVQVSEPTVAISLPCLQFDMLPSPSAPVPNPAQLALHLVHIIEDACLLATALILFVRLNSYFTTVLR